MLGVLIEKLANLAHADRHVLRGQRPLEGLQHGQKTFGIGIRTFRVAAIPFALVPQNALKDGALGQGVLGAGNRLNEQFLPFGPFRQRGSAHSAGNQSDGAARCALDNVPESSGHAFHGKLPFVIAEHQDIRVHDGRQGAQFAPPSHVGLTDEQKCVDHDWLLKLCFG